MLTPSIAVITNIDREHMESYGGFSDLQQAFADFANKVPFYGAVIACADDPHVASILPHLRRRARTYGLDNPVAHFAGIDVQLGAFGGRCLVERRTAGTELLGALSLGVPGRHNLQNALAVVAVAEELGVGFGAVAEALAGFEGVERRFQLYGDAGGVLVVDDYAHHPTEIAAVLAAAKATLDRRLIAVFQPHRFTRTQQLMNEFGPSLRDADVVVLTDIYAAGEDAIPGVTLDALVRAVELSAGRPVHVAPTLDEALGAVVSLARLGDAVLTLGAGSIGTLPARLVEALNRKEQR
jgi:UDP-N-acetylmuramate--alanine ligase